MNITPKRPGTQYVATLPDNVTSAAVIDGKLVATCGDGVYVWLDKQWHWEGITQPVE